MDIIEKSYGKEIFLLYGLFANVPGQRTWPRKIFVTITVLILLLATFLQILVLVIENFQRKIMLEYLPTTVTTAGTLIYIPYVIYSTDEEYRVLLLLMVNDLREERTEEENEIKRKYTESTKFFINGFIIIFGAAMIGIPLSGFIPYFLDLLIPLNETRERHLLVRSDTLFNQEKYFYQLYLFECCVVFLLGIIIGVSENMAVIFSQHFWSVMAVIGHRLETLTHVQDHKLAEESDFMELVTHRLLRCIEAHQKSVQYISLIDEFYDFPLTLVLIGTFSALTVSLAQATDPQLTNVTIILFTVAQVFQLFIICYLGQKTIDTSKQISVNAYNSDWHICTPRVRKMLQMTIMRSSKPYVLIVRGMFALSVENFMVVMQTVTSFYMVLRQTL